MIPPVIIINGPTAVGKTAVIKLLLKRMPLLATGITYTTRPDRKQKKEDKKMIYLSNLAFQKKIKQHQLLEYATYSGHWYGTARSSLRTNGRPLLLNIELKGALQIKKQFPNTLMIFIRPESISQLRRRLLARKLDPHDFQRRYRQARKDLQQAHFYDFQVINHQGKIGATVTAVRKHIENYLQQDHTIDKDNKNRYHQLAK